MNRGLWRSDGNCHRGREDLATRICRNSLESEIGIAVRHRFAQNCVPEQHSGFSRFPGVVDNLVPKSLSVDLRSSPADQIEEN